MKYKYYLRDTKSPRNLEKVWQVILAGSGFPHVANPPNTLAKALAWVGGDVRGEVWFGSPHKGIPPVLTILLCSLKLHVIWVMLLI